jgi:hypothetical protein
MKLQTKQDQTNMENEKMYIFRYETLKQGRYDLSQDLKSRSYERPKKCFKHR